MGFLRNIWNWLTGKSTDEGARTGTGLYPIDVEKLARELKLAEHAERLGKAGLPAADARVPSGPEAAAIQRVEKARQDYVDWAVMRLRVLSENITRRSAIRNLKHALQADEEFERKASHTMAEHEALLRSLGDTARSRQAELARFREENRLLREAHYPSSTGTFLRWSILAVLIVVEAVINARFFAHGLDTGLIGGFTQAGSLAAFNVLLAFFFGKLLLPYLWHVRVPWKIVGFISLMLALAAMCITGLGIAHYRDALVSGAADPAREALQTVQRNPLHLQDFFSWALFGISVGFALASLVDGISSDDTYPGYGRISRHTQDAIDNYESELEDLRARLEEIREEELKSLERTLKDAQAATAAIESDIGHKQDAGARLGTAMRNADNSLDALLRKFRTENELHRGATPRPAYFDSHPVLRPLQMPDFDTSDDESMLGEQKALVTKLLGEIQEIRARIQAAFTRQFELIKPLGEHFPNKETG